MSHRWLICQKSDRRPDHGITGHGIADRRIVNRRVADRWVTAAYRFAPLMMPEDQIPLIQSVSIEASQRSMSQWIQQDQPCLLLWHMEPENYVAILDSIMRIAASPSGKDRHHVMQWVASDQFLRGQKSVLAEIGIQAFLRHPEDLPRYGPLVRSHFSSLRKS